MKLKPKPLNGLQTTFYFLLLLLITSAVKGQEVILESGKSKPNSININDYSGTNYQNVKRGVFVMSTKQKSTCSGTLLNTVNQNGKYYFITAQHCFLTPKVEEGDEFEFYYSFDYEVEQPSQRTAELLWSITYPLKGKLVYTDSLQDIALIEIDKESIQNNYFFSNLYFNGWSNHDLDIPFYTVGHPQKDVKKVFPVFGYSIEEDSSIHSENDLRVNFKPLAHEKGNSGAGMFNKNNQVMAILNRQAITSTGNPVNENEGSANYISNTWMSLLENPLLQKFLDPELTYVSQVPGGYGLEDGLEKIEDRHFNLSIPSGMPFKTPQIATNGDTQKMIKLNLNELYKIASSVNSKAHYGGINLKQGEAKLTITAYINNSPLVIYESMADGSGSKSLSGNFEEKILHEININEIRQIISSLSLDENKLDSSTYNVPVLIELKTNNVKTSSVRAVKIPGLGYRNAVELFNPTLFRTLYTNKNYKECRALNSEDDYLNSVVVTVKDRGSISSTETHKTEDNGGYVNLLQHEFPVMQSGSTQDPEGSMVELTFEPANTNEVMHYSVWIDYNEDRQFTSSDENVLNISETGTATGSFTIPPNKATNGTRIRIAIRKGSAPPANGSGRYDIGEVEDYTVVIVLKNSNEEQVALSPSQVPIKEGNYYLEGLLEKGLKLGTNSEGQTTVNEVVTSDGTTTSYAALTPIYIKPTLANDGNQYIFSFDNNTQYLTVNDQNDYVQSIFDGKTLLSRDFGTTKTETSLKVYSFTITESGQEKTYYAFQDKDGGVYDIVMPYRLIPVSSSTTSSENTKEPLSASADHKTIIGGTLGGGALITTGVLGYVFRRPLSLKAGRFIRNASKLVKKSTRVSTCNGSETEPLLNTTTSF